MHRKSDRVGRRLKLLIGLVGSFLCMQPLSLPPAALLAAAKRLAL